MKLHHLTATAFGPFAETVEVDFDELSAGGVFLLTGDTGAGKTSVLDAVCFALYGEVPGDRHAARHLRSDHAPPQAEPRVTLELSIADRTLRCTRSPAWERPKKRGPGTTRVQAHVVIEELRAGEWVTLTHRLDEAGHLVTTLLGMTCTQFTQVAMLPQNRFQAFLRATSAERQTVLQRLFRTERFEAVERWLVERRTSRRRASVSCQEQVSAVLHRFGEVSGIPLPSEWDALALATAADSGAVLAWAEHTQASAHAEVSARAADLATVDAELTEASRRLTTARADAGHRSRGLAARAALADLDRSAAEHRGAVTRLEAHLRAGPVLPLARRAGLATETLDRAEDRAQEQVARMAELLDAAVSAVDASFLEAAATDLIEQRALAEAWLPREDDLAESHRRCRTLTDEAEKLERSCTDTDADLVALAARREGLRDDLQSSARMARALPDRQSTLAQVQLAHQASLDATTLGGLLTEQRRVLAATTQHVLDLREEHLNLREARISGMAAELAGALAVGCSCPVCGSAEHPSPATAFSRVTRDDEDTAFEAYEVAAFEQQALQESVTTLDTQLRAALLTSGGHRQSHWTARLEDARAAHAAATNGATRLDTLRSELDGLDATERALTEHLGAARVGLAERQAALAAAQARLSELTSARAALLADHDLDSVADLVAHLVQVAAGVSTAQTALTTLERARADRDTAVAEVVAAAREAGFATVRQAVAAHLPEPAATRLQADLEGRRDTRVRADAVLTDPDVQRSLERPEVDLAALGELTQRSAEIRDRVHAAHQQATTRERRLVSLLADLTSALETWEPVRAEHRLAAELASLAEGTSTANTWRMRLSAYVLSTRLRQVVAAANERLGAMTDQRFVLEQADARGAGEQRGGLSLRVRDLWSGTHRDPATLSGGETFVVSLALALGLADTVSHEAGGTQLDTLFIDEGFGALDATTLDGVMDTLDSLRDGGRVVGLVSHVPELRNRITTQLEVRKGRRGSTVLTVP